MKSNYMGALAAIVVSVLPHARASPTLDSHLEFQRAENNTFQFCNTTLKERKPWTWLTSAEKRAYLDADLCLMNSPSRLNLSSTGVNETTRTRWDDLHWIHIYMTNDIHQDGQFLPWHRYFVHAHEMLIRNECNYTGPLPYWNETADSANITASPLLQADAFGGNGKYVANSSEPCVTDGAFSNLTLRMHRPTESNSEYCLYRNFTESEFALENQTYVDECLAYDDYQDLFNCLDTYVHAGGHEGVNGIMGDVTISPGDPIFYLHHGWLDALWWKWQMVDPGNRTFAIGGQNYEPAEVLQSEDAPPVPESLTEYNGDRGNITTLTHNLYVQLIPNTTVGAVMDMRGQVICSNYSYGEW